MNTILDSIHYTDRTLIEAIVASFYIVDYAFVTDVNTDGTINVTHAKLLKGRNGENFKPTKTNDIELLTLSGKGFSIKLDIKKGDGVLLLGLKNYVPTVKDINTATESEFFVHYSRETLKALPLCVFNDDAKIKIEIDDGNLNIQCSGDAKIKCSNAIVEASSFKVQGSSGVASLEVST